MRRVVLRHCQRRAPPGDRHILRIERRAMQRHHRLHLSLSGQRTYGKTYRQLRFGNRLIERAQHMDGMPVVACETTLRGQRQPVRLIRATIYPPREIAPGGGGPVLEAWRRPCDHRHLYPLIARIRPDEIVQCAKGRMLHDGKRQQIAVLIFPEARILRRTRARATETIGQIADVQILCWVRPDERDDALIISITGRRAHPPRRISTHACSPSSAVVVYSTPGRNSFWYESHWWRAVIPARS